MAFPPPLQQPDYYVPPPNENRPAGVAIASMVCGILSLPLLCLWPVSIPLAIVAVALGVVGRGQVRRGTGGGGGMATAGLVCGTIALVIVGVFVVMIVIAAIAGSSGPGTHWP